MLFSIPPELLLLATLCLIPAATASNCFNYNGTDRNDDSWDVIPGSDFYQPCTKSDDFSMCCRLAGGADACRSDDLCQQKGSSNIWRESCTDSEWGSSCLDLCVRNDIGDMKVYQCHDQSWCCQGGPENLDPTDCCAQGTGKWIVKGKVTDVNPNATSTSTSSHSTSTLATSSSTSSGGPTTTPGTAKSNSGASSSSKGGGSNTGAIAGGVIGGVVVGLLIAGAVWFVLRKRKRDSRMQGQQREPHQFAGEGGHSRVPAQYDMGIQKEQPPGVHEMEGERADPELDNYERSELMGSKVKN